MTRLDGIEGHMFEVTFLPDRVIGLDFRQGRHPDDSRWVLLQWTFAGGEPFSKTTFDKPHELIASRSGTQVLAREGGYGRDVTLHELDLSTGALTALVSGLYRGHDTLRRPQIRWSPDERCIAVALDAASIGIYDRSERTLAPIDELPPDCVPFVWDREGLIASRPNAHESRHVALYRTNPIRQTSAIWESPDGSRRVQNHPDGLSIDHGDGWRTVPLAGDSLKWWRHTIEHQDLVPPWLGREWYLWQPRARFDLSSGAITPLGFGIGSHAGAALDGSRIAWKRSDDAIELVAIK